MLCSGHNVFCLFQRDNVATVITALFISLICSLFMPARNASAASDGDSPLDKLEPCSGRPNCVSSVSTDEMNRVDPIPFQGCRTESEAKLLKLINSLERATVVVQKENYIKVEIRSAVFRFVDDVEFVFDDANQLIHFKSVARNGYYDFGVNRRRMNAIRSHFSTPDP